MTTGLPREMEVLHAPPSLPASLPMPLALPLNGPLGGLLLLYQVMLDMSAADIMSAEAWSAACFSLTGFDDVSIGFPGNSSMLMEKALNMPDQLPLGPWRHQHP